MRRIRLRLRRNQNFRHRVRKIEPKTLITGRATRPDICYAVNFLSKFTGKVTNEIFFSSKYIRRILQYVISIYSSFIVVGITFFERPQGRTSCWTWYVSAPLRNNSKICYFIIFFFHHPYLQQILVISSILLPLIKSHTYLRVVPKRIASELES